MIAKMEHVVHSEPIEIKKRHRINIYIIPYISQQTKREGRRIVVFIEHLL